MILARIECLYSLVGRREPLDSEHLVLNFCINGNGQRSNERKQSGEPRRSNSLAHPIAAPRLPSWMGISESERSALSAFTLKSWSDTVFSGLSGRPRTSSAEFRGCGRERTLKWDSMLPLWASPSLPEPLDLPEKSGRRDQLVIRMCQGDC